MAQPNNRSTGQTGSTSSHWPKYNGLMFTIRAVSCRRRHLFMGPPAFKAPLHLFLEYSAQMFHKLFEMLVSCGHQVPLYPLLSRRLQNSIEIPCFQLLGSCHQLLTLSGCIPEGIPLTHRNLLRAIRGLSVEKDSANAT